MSETPSNVAGRKATPSVGSAAVHPLAHALIPLFSAYFDGAIEESLLVAGLDSAGRLSSFNEWPGSPDMVGDVCRPLLTTLAQERVSHVVIAHNHPDDFSHATPADRIATRTLANLATLSGAYLVDHIIFHRNGWLSLRAHGVIS